MQFKFHSYQTNKQEKTKQNRTKQTGQNKTGQKQTGQNKTRQKKAFFLEQHHVFPTITTPNCRPCTSFQTPSPADDTPHLHPTSP